MKSIANILDLIRRKISQSEYFDILSELEKNVDEFKKIITNMEAQMLARDVEVDKLREQYRYAKREKDAAESFLADMTNQRDTLAFENKKLDGELKMLKEQHEDAAHDEAYKAHLAKKTAVTQ